MLLACRSAMLPVGLIAVWGAGVFHLGNVGAQRWREARNGAHAFPGGTPFNLSLPAHPVHTAASACPGLMGMAEARFAPGRSPIPLRGASHVESHDQSRLQRRLNRDFNERRSGHVMAGMVLLLAVCGWISGGEDGVLRAVREGMPSDERLPISPEVMRRRFGARLLHPHEMPALFAMLHDICRRAHLARMPDVYFIAAPHTMNAYALGGPEASAITLTEGLLRGLTLSEIGGILAHEIAHIRNNDGWAMRWAAALHRAIAQASVVALMALQTQRRGATPTDRPLAMLLAGASAIGQLLCLALSRIRELDADALALELIGDAEALVA